MDGLFSGAMLVLQSSHGSPYLYVSLVSGAGRAWVKPGVGWRYLDRWSLLDTWANQDGDL